MNYGQELFENLMKTVQAKPEKFFANDIEYDGRNLIIFDYSLTIPNDFGTGDALELRGSCFEVDEKGDYVSLVALPYEKFFNPHELDYGGNTDLQEKLKERYGVECSSDAAFDLANDSNTVIMEKLDGSIITFFDWYGDIDCKSNSSLTSDYKYEALELLKSDAILYALVYGLVQEGYSVMAEYVSSLPTRQIVVPYTQDQLIITGVRSHEDGSYMSYKDMLQYFTENYVVKNVQRHVDSSIFDEQDIEGYVFWHEPTGFRGKLKTEWYLNRHRMKESTLFPSNIWELYIKEDIDDILQSLPQSSIDYVEHFVERCDDLYFGIIDKGYELYETYKHLDSKHFHMSIVNKKGSESYALSYTIASMLYKGTNKKDVHEHIKKEMLKRKKVSRLGITEWKYDPKE